MVSTPSFYLAPLELHLNLVLFVEDERGGVRLSGFALEVLELSRATRKASLGDGLLFASTKNPAVGSSSYPPPGVERLTGGETQVQAV